MNFESLPNNDNNYCVYFHKRKTDGVVFYIGSGVRNKREFHFSSRSKAWNLVKEKHGVDVEIYAENLSKLSARDIEDELIKSGKYKEIVNTNTVCKLYKGLSTDDLHGLVSYDETSPTCLSWTDKQTNKRVKGKPAGCLTFDKKKKPYGGSVKLNKVNRQINRVVWVLNNGSLGDDLVIDHIDGDKHNNKISNLRALTIAENSRNRASCVNKTSSDLPIGVFERKTCFTSMVTIAGNSKTVSFSKNKYGFEEAKRKAIAWRSDMLSKLNALGANYSERHFKQDTSGVDYSHKPCSYTGVKNTAVKKNKDGTVRSYEAYFNYAGKTYTRSYAVSKHGEDNARRLAIEMASKGKYSEEDTVIRSKVKIEIRDIVGNLLGVFDSAADASRYLKVDLRKVYKNIYGEVKKNLKNNDGDEVILKRIRQTSESNII